MTRAMAVLPKALISYGKTSGKRRLCLSTKGLTISLPHTAGLGYPPPIWLYWAELSATAFEEKGVSKRSRRELGVCTHYIRAQNSIGHKHQVCEHIPKG